MRKIIRQIVPKSLRLRLQLGVQFFKNINANFAKNKLQSIDYKHFIILKQPIMYSAFMENKIHNISLGATKIEKIIIEPNQTFSFWSVVKNPNQGAGFRVGRNLVNGRLSEDYGGGLCQLSSIIYHTSLMSGLEIVERHHHSLDIYEEHERYTPLGADATVVLGYKDLKIRNLYSFPVYFSFIIFENTITCNLYSDEKISLSNIRFERENQGEKILVKTVNEANDVLEKSIYLKKKT